MWLSISRGKASREQVFVKLGVENRASAAARAIRALAR
jgi:DNA-binding CsgD family transcriptional regulator